jgi:hypothetical protein
MRLPSTLLRHCERNATPRQRRLMNGGTQTPDRFLPTRAGTPTKESLLLTKQRPKSRDLRHDMEETDPFGPVPARSLRMAEQFATVRNPTPPRVVGAATRVQDAQSPSGRSLSAGTVWTVGGSMVTEGVASVSTGRGGRVTSGTNAAHYSADFLRKSSPSEDEIMHSRRLALAMNIDQGARMLVHTPPASPTSSLPSSASPIQCSRVWKDGIWQQEGVVTRAWALLKPTGKRTY